MKREKFRKEKEKYKLNEVFRSTNFSRNSPASATAVYSNQYSRPDSMPGYTSQRYKISYDNVVCFQCGRLGHYRSFCSDNNKTHTVQIPNVQGQRQVILIILLFQKRNLFLESEIGRFWEVCEIVDSLVARKLIKNIDFWESTLQESPFVVSMIRNEYTLPFNSKPAKFYAINNASSLKHKTFVEESIDELKTTNCIREVATLPHCVNPLTLAEGWLVIDLRHANKHLYLNKFKYEGLHIIQHLIHKDSYFFTFDLKNRYHHISILEEHQTFFDLFRRHHKIFYFSGFSFWACQFFLRIYKTVKTFS